MPEPVGAHQRIVLDVLWVLLLRGGRWPTFQELDLHLYRALDLDAAQLLVKVPPGLLYGVNTGSAMPIAGTTTIGLTAAGAYATGRAQRELDLFLAVVRQAAAMERDFDPPADRPDLQADLVSADVAMLLGLSLPEDSALLKRLSAILYTERWGWTSFGGLGTDTWKIRIGREVRRFQQVRDIATYWELRPKHWLPDKPVPVAMRSPAATRRQGAVVQAARDSIAKQSLRHVDVLVVAATPEEFDAARKTASAADPSCRGVVRWEQRDSDGPSPYLLGEYRIDGKPPFTVALARPTQMGARSTGPVVARLVERLRPASLAMCGVCAGNPASTALGDVVIGTPVFEWDEGKHSAAGFEGAYQQFSLSPRWRRTGEDFNPVNLPSYGKPSEPEAFLWLLEQLYRGQQTRDHPARAQYFPNGTWLPGLERLEEQDLIGREPTGEAVLTRDGSAYVQRRLYDDVDGPQRLPFRVLVGPMASGSAVMADPDVWNWLKAMGMRKIAAVDMEAATIATIADQQELSWLVVKGVTDHADAQKDDRYKQFAARASAQVMFALLERLVHAPVVAAGDPTVEPVIYVPNEPIVDPTTVRPTGKPVPAEQQNAVRSAKRYLQTAAFSRKGLIEQLSSDAGDGYSSEAATLAVDSLDIDYDEQAAKSAQNYLRMSGFSRKGLIEQLEYEGFTHSQAVHGVDEAGL
ncbi:Ltp family lipoprotein [Actinoplanes sp. CA-051413]|uniref:Ltp family lipoprotein n=1 Tax=Actinoplanes sp. CA-051413 TaxID=3239899 RepID=UPI003D99BFBE